MRASFIATTTFVLFGAASAEQEVDVATIIATYDHELCVTAQRILINADPGEINIVVNRAPPGSGFGTLQMNTRPESGDIVVAMLTERADTGGDSLDTSVWCKLVNQERVNDVLERDFTPPRTCRDVNESTYRQSRALLTGEEKRTYETSGMPLRFIDDWNAEAGAAWIPSIVNDFIEPVEASDDAPAYLRIQAPSVQVPWDPVGRDWYKGTHNCKLITLAAMYRWMSDTAFSNSTELFPRTTPECTAPTQMTSQIGSCVQFFGPANALFCTDYSGPGWTDTAAREECLQRHATEAAWLAKGRAFAGDGGVFSTDSCAERDAIAEVRDEPWRAHSGQFGTCVFRCNGSDETLWHSLTEVSSGNQGRGGMQKACDLFIP